MSGAAGGIVLKNSGSSETTIQAWNSVGGMYLGAASDGSPFIALINSSHGGRGNWLRGTPSDQSISIYGNLVPASGYAPTLGSAASPFTSIYIGASATNNYQVAGTATAARTWTLQDTSDYFVGRATTDTLTNKTLSISANTLKSSTNTAGHVPRNNGTQYVDGQLAAADLSNGTTGSGGIVLAGSPSLTTPSFSWGSASGTPTYTGTSTGIGNGASTNLTAAAKSTGSGPASLAVVTWVQVSFNGSTYWMPLFQ